MWSGIISLCIDTWNKVVRFEVDRSMIIPRERKPVKLLYSPRPILEMRVINVKRQKDTGLFVRNNQKRWCDVRGEEMIL